MTNQQQPPTVPERIWLSAPYDGMNRDTTVHEHKHFDDDLPYLLESAVQAEKLVVNGFIEQVLRERLGFEEETKRLRARVQPVDDARVGEIRRFIETVGNCGLYPDQASDHLKYLLAHFPSSKRRCGESVLNDAEIAELMEWLGSANATFRQRVLDAVCPPVAATGAGEGERREGWVTFGRIKSDIENETETFERIHPPAPATAPAEAAVRDYDANDGVKSSALFQRYARMWSATEGVERRYSLHDRYWAVRVFVHAIDHVANQRLPFDVQANAQSVLRDGIYNALDHRATGREWRNIRHTYNPERDGPFPPGPAEEDRRCENCGALNPTPFTYCHAKNHAPSTTTPTEPAAIAAREIVTAWLHQTSAGDQQRARIDIERRLRSIFGGEK